MTQYEEADEYCPYCDNHYVSTACHSELPAACWLAQHVMADPPPSCRFRRA